MWKNISSKTKLLGISALISLSGVSAATAQSLVNPSFEDNNVQTLQGLGAGQTLEGSGNPGYVIVTANNINGWQTTAANNGIEVWQSGFSPGGNTVDRANVANGTQFVEINATQSATLFQDLTIGAAAGTTQLYFNFWHRARAEDANVEVNVLRLTITDLGANAVIGGGDDVQLFSRIFATELNPLDIGSTNGWANYDSAQFGNTISAAAGVARPIRFSYEALTGNGITADIFQTTGATPTMAMSTTVDATNAQDTFGNFLDNAQFSTDPSVSVPFDFSPNLGVGILGGLYLGNKAFKSWKKSKDENA